MTHDPHGRLWDLFAASAHETLTESEHLELQTILRTNREARQLWFLNQDLALGLNRLLQIPVAESLSLREISPTPLVSAATIAEPRLLESASGVLNRRPARSGGWIAVIMVIAVACCWILIRPRLPLDHARPVAEPKDAGRRFNVHAIEALAMVSPMHGTTFRMDDHRGKLIALHFLLKTECPYCLKLAHDYTLLAAATPNVLHLWIKPDSEEDIRSWALQIRKEDLHEIPVIYRDLDARLATAFGIPGGYQFHGFSVHYPALVLIDESGQELFRYIGKDNADRMAPDEFMTRLALVSRQNSSGDRSN